MSRRSAALLPPAATALVAAMVLAGCTVPESTPTTTPPPTSSESPAPSPDPTETAAPPRSTPVNIACDVLVPAQTMYDFNPNFSHIDPWTPAAGTAAADALEAEGVACQWQNDTSRETIDVSVASFDEGTLDELANDAYTNSTMVPTYGGDEAYFTVTDGVGEAIVFEGSYWVVVTSAYFMEPGDAEPIIASVLAAL